MSENPALSALASSAFSLPKLRDGQLAGMAALVTGRDVLAVMPTGYGKSAIYQVAALHLHQQLGRPAVVVSPLIALQEDQVAGLAEALGGDAAVAISSAHTDAEVVDAWEQVESGRAAFLFLAPEQLARKETVERLAAVGPALLVVDEAHCVSSWGHDFRPDYLALGAVREQLGNPAVAALTATASPPVREEIAERLGMKDPLVIVHGFDRPNITLDVVRHHEEKEKRGAVLEQVVAMVRGSGTGARRCGLVYAATRKDTEKYAARLAGEGVRAEAYHAGRAAADRERILELFMDDQLEVVVATTAFGMGIDKAAVRFVIHAHIPESLDSYYQELGRAGRDGHPASAILHYRAEDLGLRKFFGTRTPDPEALLAVLKVLRSADGPVFASSLTVLTGFKHRRMTGLLNQLQDAGAVTSGKRGFRFASKAKPAVLVQRAADLAEARQRVDQSRLHMMRGYAETDGCRRQFLLGYFGEDLPEPCGGCDTCTGRTLHAAPQPVAEPDGGAGRETADLPFPLQSAVTHKKWGAGLVMRYEDDVMTVLFEQEGYKMLSREAVIKRKLLKPA